MEDSLPHTASVLHVPAVLRVQLGVGLGGVTLREGFKIKIKCRNFHIEQAGRDKKNGKFPHFGLYLSIFFGGGGESRPKILKFPYFLV